MVDTRLWVLVFNFVLRFVVFCFVGILLQLCWRVCGFTLLRVLLVTACVFVLFSVEYYVPLTYILWVCYVYLVACFWYTLCVFLAF